ncbi:hypothetical protein GCM10023196_084010 [Actinoallomurus vinaceus]|uniref:Uncharacterized protein n=1 Tax=Actinoallomurus vinaceus TaxID=1080074 RepID=A0ABP8UNJ0_9ACTN
MLKMKSASLGLVASAVAGVLLTGSPANAQPDLAGYWHHHSSHRFYHSHRHIALNHNRPRIFIRIFIYNRNNNIAIARNGQAQAQRERQRQFERQRQRQEFEDPGAAMSRPGAPGTSSAPVKTSSAPSTTQATPTTQVARPQVAGGPSAVREQAPGTAPLRQSASADEASGAGSSQTP